MKKKESLSISSRVPFVFRLLCPLIGILGAGCVSSLPPLPAPPAGDGYRLESQGFVDIYESFHTLVEIKSREKEEGTPSLTFSPGQSLRGHVFNPHLLPLLEIQEKERKDQEKKESREPK